MDTRNPSTLLPSIVFVVSLCCAHVAYSATAPCALLTQNQVSTIVGGSVGARLSDCEYGMPLDNVGCTEGHGDGFDARHQIRAAVAANLDRGVVLADAAMLWACKASLRATAEARSSLMIFPVAARYRLRH